MIGDNTAVAGGVIMAGSLKIGRYCMIGGASVINGHMEICDKVTVTGMGMVMRPITEPGRLFLRHSAATQQSLAQNRCTGDEH